MAGRRASHFPTDFLHSCEQWLSQVRELSAGASDGGSRHGYGDACTVAHTRADGVHSMLALLGVPVRWLTRSASGPSTPSAQVVGGRQRSDRGVGLTGSSDRLQGRPWPVDLVAVLHSEALGDEPGYSEFVEFVQQPDAPQGVAGGAHGRRGTG